MTTHTNIQTTVVLYISHCPALFPSQYLQFSEIIICLHVYCEFHPTRKQVTRGYKEIFVGGGGVGWEHKEWSFLPKVSHLQQF